MEEDPIKEKEYSLITIKEYKYILLKWLSILLIITTVYFGFTCFKTNSYSKDILINENKDKDKLILTLEEQLIKIENEKEDLSIDLNILTGKADFLKEKNDELTEELREYKTSDEYKKYTRKKETLANIEEIKNNSDNITNNFINTSSSSLLTTITLSNGTYKVGTDIASGTYDLEGISGFGLLTGDFESGFLSETIGISDLFPNNKTYKGLRLTDGDEFTIKSGVTIEFVPR